MITPNTGEEILKPLLLLTIRDGHSSSTNQLHECRFARAILTQKPVSGSDHHNNTHVTIMLE